MLRATSYKYVKEESSPKSPRGMNASWILSKFLHKDRFFFFSEESMNKFNLLDYQS